MKAIVQRVLSASVTVDSELISSISKGLLVFAAVGPDDDESDAVNMAGRVLKMKFWDDEEGGRVFSRVFDTRFLLYVVGCSRSCHCVQWKKNVVDIGGEILCVSQFTLLANTKKGSKVWAFKPRISGIHRRAFINGITAQPDFHGAMEPEKAKALYDAFFKRVQQDYQPEKVKDGVFQAMMQDQKLQARAPKLLKQFDGT
ncbi:hypothetical protein ABW21_db0208254 [Orbilia brochopaga]|nr:hypothetical protein ABW21_db0208254 [Drechslerella brochopaga]